MKCAVCLLMFLMLVGCASKQPSSSKIDVPEKESVELPSGEKLEIQVWPESAELDPENAEPRSLSDKLSDMLKEGSGFHFRKVRWGFNRERVKLAEVGSTPPQQIGNALVYKTKVNGVYCNLIYTFKENRLRTAGYLTITPIPNADDLIKEAIEKHGEPESNRSYCGGLQEKVWKTHDTVIFANLYPTVKKKTRTSYEYSPEGGLFREIPHKRLPAQEPGTISYWDGTYAHVDPAFFQDLHEANLPVSELSFYEKRLMGVILRKGGTQIPGLGTIP